MKTFYKQLSQSNNTKRVEETLAFSGEKVIRAKLNILGEMVDLVARQAF